MFRTSRVVAAAAVGAVMLVAARPVADLARSMPEDNLVAVPVAGDPVSGRQADQRFSRDELARRELNAKAIADGAQARSSTLATQADGIAASEKSLQKAETKRKAAAAARKAEAKRKAEAAQKAEQRRQAAAEAQRKKAASAQKKSAAADSGSGSGSAGAADDDAAKASTPTGSPQSIAKKMMASDYGWGASQFSCYNNIIIRESNWDYRATNPSSGAYGIPQSLPGNKMASAGSDWRTNPATQIEWSLGYIKDRYGTPCQAWSFKSAKGWY